VVSDCHALRLAMCHKFLPLAVFIAAYSEYYFVLAQRCYKQSRVEESLRGFVGVRMAIKPFRDSQYLGRVRSIASSGSLPLFRVMQREVPFRRVMIGRNLTMSGVSAMSGWEEDDTVVSGSVVVPRTVHGLEQMMYNALATLQLQREQRAVQDSSVLSKKSSIDLKYLQDGSSCMEDSTSVSSDGRIAVMAMMRGEATPEKNPTISPTVTPNQPRARAFKICGILLVGALLVLIVCLVVLGNGGTNKNINSSTSDTGRHPSIPVTFPITPPLASPVPAPNTVLAPVAVPSTVDEPVPPGPVLPVLPGPVCFTSRDELLSAIDEVLGQAGNLPTSTVYTKYGWPMNTWCVGAVTSLAYAFSTNRNINATDFNEDISAWNTSSVTDMTRTFSGCQTFNQDVSKWDVSLVTSMVSMFVGATAFQQDLSLWKVGNVKSMSGMFRNAKSFAPESLESWDMSQVASTQSMFWGASQFNARISTWNVQNVKNAASMFRDASAFTQDVSAWNFANVRNLSNFLSGVAGYSQDLCAWRTRLPIILMVVTNMFFGTACPVTIVVPDEHLATWVDYGSFCYDCSASVPVGTP
jgi:surface protein